jgi:hypothetical protein
MDERARCDYRGRAEIMDSFRHQKPGSAGFSSDLREQQFFHGAIVREFYDLPA